MRNSYVYLTQEIKDVLRLERGIPILMSETGVFPYGEVRQLQELFYTARILYCAIHGLSQGNFYLVRKYSYMGYAFFTKSPKHAFIKIHSESAKLLKMYNFVIT
jgi:hypothetical protein